MSQKKQVKKAQIKQQAVKTVDIKVYGLILLGILAIILYYYSKTFDFIRMIPSLLSVM